MSRDWIQHRAWPPGGPPKPPIGQPVRGEASLSMDQWLSDHYHGRVPRMSADYARDVALTHVDSDLQQHGLDCANLYDVDGQFCEYVTI